MQVKYTGDIPILVMHEGKVWEVEPGDTLDVKEAPNHPQFEAVKESKKQVEEAN